MLTSSALGRVLLQYYMILQGLCKVAPQAGSLNTLAPAPILRKVAQGTSDSEPIHQSSSTAQRVPLSWGL